jgi:hypothetical protein
MERFSAQLTGGCKANAIVDDSCHILPEVLAARRRGVRFDIGAGEAGHMRWDTIGAIMNAGFWPDAFSTAAISFDRSSIHDDFGLMYGGVMAVTTAPITRASQSTLALSCTLRHFEIDHRIGSGLGG